MVYRILQIAVPFIWFGLIGGISFLEAPLKFQAPNITLALGLGIGKLVFFWLNKIEIAFALILTLSLIKARPKNKFPIYCFGVIAILLLLETFWLLPVLDARAAAVISGTAEPYSNTHIIYIVFDSIKFILLFVFGLSRAKSLLILDRYEK